MSVCRYDCTDETDQGQIVCTAEVDDEQATEENEGSHTSLTFWLYFILRFIYESNFQSLFSINDAVASTAAKVEKFPYPIIYLFGVGAATISGLVGGNI